MMVMMVVMVMVMMGDGQKTKESLKRANKKWMRQREYDREDHTARNANERGNTA